MEPVAALSLGTVEHDALLPIRAGPRLPSALTTTALSLRRRGRRRSAIAVPSLVATLTGPRQMSVLLHGVMGVRRGQPVMVFAVITEATDRATLAGPLVLRDQPREISSLFRRALRARFRRVTRALAVLALLRRHPIVQAIGKGLLISHSVDLILRCSSIRATLKLQLHRLCHFLPSVRLAERSAFSIERPTLPKDCTA